MYTSEEDIELKKVGLELMFLTPEKYDNEEGITAVELSKLVELPLDVVKKKLSILKEKNIVRVKGNNPKSLFSGKVKTWSLSITIVSSIATKFIPELTVLTTLLSIITSTLQIKTTNDYYEDYKKSELFRNRNKKENCNNDKQLHHSQKNKQLIYSKQEQINYLTNLKHNLLHEETIKPKTMVKK